MTPPRTFAGFSKDDALRQLEAERIEAEKATAEHKRLEDLARGNAEGGNVSAPGNAGFSIKEFSTFYSVGGIRDLDDDCVYDFYKNTLESKTQDKYIEHASNANVMEFHACAAPLIYAICKTLYENKDGAYNTIVENARKCLAEIFQKRITTLSSVYYSADKNLPDVVQHYHKKSPTFERQGFLVGPNGPITDPKTKAEDYVGSLLDTGDTMGKVNDVFKWVTGKDVYTFRHNTKPVEKDKTAFFFCGDINTNFHLTTLHIPDVIGEAIGVSRAQTNTPAATKPVSDNTFAGFDLDEVVRQVDEAKRQAEANKHLRMGGAQ